jgi:hypothetical protein
VREAAEEFRTQGRMVTPPDVEPDVEKANQEEKDFWDEVERRLTSEERAWLQTSDLRQD